MNSFGIIQHFPVHNSMSKVFLLSPYCKFITGRTGKEPTLIIIDNLSFWLQNLSQLSSSAFDSTNIANRVGRNASNWFAHLNCRQKDNLHIVLLLNSAIVCAIFLS